MHSPAVFFTLAHPLQTTTIANTFATEASTLANRRTVCLLMDHRPNPPWYSGMLRRACAVAAFLTCNSEWPSAGSGQHQALVGSIFQFLENVASEMLFDLAMARNRLAGAGLRILIPIVPAARPNEHAPIMLNLADEVASFHASWSSAT